MRRIRKESVMSATQPLKASRREWIGLATLALPCMLYSMDLTVLNLAVPHLSADLKPTSSQLLWIVDIYGFLLAGALITMGTLGDRIGRRRLLLIGATAFGTASIFAAFSTSAEMLIFARALLGLAAATLAPSTLSLLSNMFHDPKERTFAIGVWISSFSAGGAIGPLIGGVLLAHFWWGSVFLIAVPVMLLLLVLGPALLPEFRDPDAGRMDIPSAALSLAAVLAVIFGIKHFAEHGLGWIPAVSILAGILLAFVFARRQNHLETPLIDLSLFKRPAFSASLAVNILAFFIAFGSFLFVAQYLQLVLGLSPLEAGLWSAPSGIAFIAASLLTSRLLTFIRPPFAMAGGLVLAAIGFALLLWAGSTDSLAKVVVAYVIFSLGLAPVFTLTTDLIIGTVPPQRAGTASGMAETSSELGGAMGIALLGSVITAVYRNGIEANAPEGVTPELLSAARDTLGGAASVAGSLGPSQGDALLASAREAFTSGFMLVSLLCMVIALVAAFLAAVALRNIGHGQTDPSPAE